MSKRNCEVLNDNDDDGNRVKKLKLTQLSTESVSSEPSVSTSNKPTFANKRLGLKIDLNSIKNGPKDNDFLVKNDPISELKNTFSFITPMLIVSGITFANNYQLLKENGVTHIINATFEGVNPFENEFRYLNVNVRDNGQDNIGLHFQKVIQFICEARDRNGVVLIHCNYGISRSVTLGCLWIMYENRISFKNALLILKQRRSKLVEPNISFTISLREWKNKNIQLNSKDNNSYDNNKKTNKIKIYITHYQHK